MSTEAFTPGTTSGIGKTFTNHLAIGLACFSMGIATPTAASPTVTALFARGTMTSPMPIERSRSAISFKSISSAIAAMRRKTGLRMEDIGNIFHVSRKTAHNWSNGKTASYDNELAIYRVAGLFERAQGTPEQIRAALGTTTSEGHLVFDLLCQGRYDEVARFLNVGSVTQIDHAKHEFDSRGKFIPAGYLVETDVPVKITSSQKLKSAQPIITKRS